MFTAKTTKSLLDIFLTRKKTISHGIRNQLILWISMKPNVWCLTEKPAMRPEKLLLKWQIKSAYGNLQKLKKPQSLWLETMAERDQNVMKPSLALPFSMSAPTSPSQSWFSKTISLEHKSRMVVFDTASATTDLRSLKKHLKLFWA